MVIRNANKRFFGQDGEIMFEWERDNGDIVLFQETTFRGRTRFDLRVWSQQGSECCPRRWIGKRRQVASFGCTKSSSSRAILRTVSLL